MSEEKSSYFDMSKALDEFNHESFGAKEKAASGLKMFGKGLFNVGKFAIAEALPAIIKQSAETNVRTADKLLRNENLTDEQRKKLEECKEKSKNHLDKIG